jgi:hypothetical protein
MKSFFDYTDQKYIEEMSNYEEQRKYSIILYGIDKKRVSLRNADGTEISTAEQLKEVLKSNGINHFQTVKIFADIFSLVKMNDEKTDFLSAAPSD